ncbi:Hypothetical predicted protein, partial [Mytilus galloprovincialis]
VNLLQTNQTQNLKEEVKMVSVVDLIKGQWKENRKSLRKEIDDLKQENKTLKTKLQKPISNYKDSTEKVVFLVQNSDIILVRVFQNSKGQTKTDKCKAENEYKSRTTEVHRGTENPIKESTEYRIRDRLVKTET